MSKSVTVNMNTFGPDDGVYFKATIAPRTRLHTGVKLTFRPVDYILRRVTSLQTSQLMANEKYDELAKAEIQQTLSRVQEWSLDDSLSDVIDGTRRINAVLMRDIYDVVWGFEAAAELEVLQKNS